ncbi:unnamed protein product [Blepharisma stoltei]|uniref:Tetratricopeptide repeat protein n=1 Tax=Blepharisma stoltei TaxID=1481888 RepID=A0AAU9K320_9CILI|nr:unnamed protein product [Blepharisma stoltei]
MEENSKEENKDNTPKESIQLFLDSFETISESLIKNSNLQELLKHLSKLLVYHTNSRYAAQVLSLGSNLVDKISKKALSNISDPYQTLSMLQSLKLILNVYPAILLPEKCALLNNLACTFRRLGKFHAAKKYLDKALELIKTNRDVPIDKSSTYLNCCAVFSNLNKHKEALDYAMQAVQYSQDDMLNLPKDIPFTDYVNKISILAISYYNIAIENEYLKKYDDSYEWYGKAIKFLNNHQETQNLVAIFDDCVKNYEEIKEKLKKRPLFSRNSRSRPISAKPNEINKSNLRDVQASPQIDVKSSNNFFDARFPLEKKPYTFEEIKSRLSIKNFPKLNPRKSLDENESETDRKLKPILCHDDSQQKFVSKSKSPQKMSAKIQKSPYRSSVIRSNKLLEVRSTPQGNHINIRKGSTPAPGNSQHHKILEEESNDTPENQSQLNPHSYYIGIDHDTPFSLTEFYANSDTPTKALHINPEKDKLIKDAVTAIQNIFRGRKYKKPSETQKGSSEIIFKAGRRIGGQYFLVMVLKSENEYKLTLNKLGEIDKVYEIPINSSQAEYPEQLIKQVQFKENGQPYIASLKPDTMKSSQVNELVIQSFSSSIIVPAPVPKISIQTEIKENSHSQLVSKLNTIGSSPSRELKQAKKITDQLQLNDSFDLLNRTPLDSSRYVFKLVLAKTIEIDSQSCLVTIYISQKYLKMDIKRDENSEEKIIKIEEAAELLKVKKERLESNTHKLCDLIQKNKGLDFIKTNVTLKGDLSSESLDTDKDSIQEDQNFVGGKAIWRNIDGSLFMLEASEFEEIINIKAANTADKSLVHHKSYTRKEIEKYYGSVLPLEAILQEVSIKNGEIVLKHEKKL